MIPRSRAKENGRDNSLAGVPEGRKLVAKIALQVDPYLAIVSSNY